MSLPERPSDPIQDPWQTFRLHTAARIALGRSGVSLPTTQVLAFERAHAQARDAVLSPLDTVALQAQLEQAQWRCVHVHSRATDRTAYLARPDWGRRLDSRSHAALKAWRQQHGAVDLCLVVADGLSSTAVAAQAPALLASLRQQLPAAVNVPIIIASQARVALGDDIAETLNSRMVIVLIGERPGLSAADSLGAYITYAPHVGRHDAERNCISNIRPAGLAIDLAAQQLAQLVQQALEQACTGVTLRLPSLPPIADDLASATDDDGKRLA